MRYGKFIYNDDQVVKEGWSAWNITFYNSREYTLEPREGILALKRSFSVNCKKELKKATLCATALGVFRLFIDDNEVGANDLLKPTWTDYRRRVFEYTYDVTELCSGGGTIFAEVSTGWWCGRISFGIYGWKKNAFCAELVLEYDDGSEDIIATDESWDVTLGTQTRTADIWDGQFDDFTLPTVFESPESYSWKKAELFDGFEGEVVSFEGERVCVRENLARAPMSAVKYCGVIDNGTEFGEVDVNYRKLGLGCESISLQKGETLLLDMEQDMVGRPVITLRAKRGTTVETFFSEMLNDSGDKARGNDGPKGSAYIKNYRTALARYKFITSGEENEVRFPTHVFYGFRYIEICADDDVEIIGVKCEVIGSDIRETGAFECSDDEINKLYSNIVWGFRGNYLSVPTDCPQRDERLGWTGDTQIFCPAAAYLGDVDPFLRKWLGDARDSQHGYEGGYCDVIPRVFASLQSSANAAWGDAGIIVPYYLYLMYRDIDVIREHYDSMEWYMRHLERFGLDGPRATYGDWLNYDVTDKAYVSVCYYAYDAFLMAKYSSLLGKTDRAEYYESLRERIVEHWAEKYLDGDELRIKTQTAYVLAFAFELVTEELFDKFKNTLRGLIIGNGYKLSTGFVGTGLLLDTLARIGEGDLCYSLLLQTDDPSWLYSVRQGATTVWERWNSYTLEKGFGAYEMNSFNHYAYGVVARWLYSGMCGIKPIEDYGFERFILEPTPDMRSFIPKGQKRITHARASYDSRYGLIESGWQIKGDEVIYSFTIPENTTATIKLFGEKVLIGGKEITPERENGKLTFSLGQGEHEIVVK